MEGHRRLHSLAEQALRRRRIAQVESKREFRASECTAKLRNIIKALRDELAAREKPETALRKGESLLQLVSA